MKKGAKAQLFTLDLLLALIPLTIALGISASAMSGVAIQMEDYISLYSKQRIVSDAADVLVKAPGEPSDWTISNMKTLGFATQLGELGCGTGLSNSTLVNVLDVTKLSNFQSNPTNSVVSSTLQNLSAGNNIRIVVTNSTDTLVDIMGYYPGGTWTVTNDSATISAVIAAAMNLYVAERPAGIITRALGTLELQNEIALSSAAIRSTPAVGDLNNDGLREIVVGSDVATGAVYAFYPNGTVIWTFTGTNYSNYISSPVLVDINGDGKLEVLIGDGDNVGGGIKGTLYAIEYDGSGLVWAYTANDKIWTSPAVADIDKDGDKEIVFGSIDNNLRVLNYTGGIKWNYTSSDKFKSSPAIGDIDSDWNLEIVVGACDNKLYAFGPSGMPGETPIWTLDLGGHIHSTPALYDVDGDGSDEIFIGSHTNAMLHAIEDIGGTPSSLWNKTGVKVQYSSPAVGDIDGDGIPEVVIGDENNKIYAFNARNGTPLWTYTTGGVVDSSPAIGDVDGDCRMEVVIGSDDGYLYVLNGEDGSLQYNYSTGSAIKSSPIIVDIDDDGLLEILFGNDNGDFYIISTSGSSGAEWPMFHQCLKRAGYYYDSDCGGSLTSSVTEAVGEDAASGNLKVYIWE